MVNIINIFTIQLYIELVFYLVVTKIILYAVGMNLYAFFVKIIGETFV